MIYHYQRLNKIVFTKRAFSSPPLMTLRPFAIYIPDVCNTKECFTYQNIQKSGAKVILHNALYHNIPDTI